MKKFYPWKRMIRDTYFRYADEFNGISSKTEEYRLRTHIYLDVRREMKENSPGTLKRDWMEELARFLGISSHALYLSVSVYQAYSDGRAPKKYCLEAYRTIQREATIKGTKQEEMSEAEYCIYEQQILEEYGN